MLNHPCGKTIIILSNPWGGDERVPAFPRGISPKVNVIARLEFELAYFKAADKHFNYYASSERKERIRKKETKNK